MTIKQKKAVEIMVGNGGNATQAMIQAGYSPNTANTPSKLTNAPEVKNELARLLKDNGVTKEQYMMNIGQAMVADKLIVHGKEEDSWVDVVPDHTTRLAGNKMAERFLKFDTEPETPTFDITGMDEVQITQALFKRKDES